MNRWSWLRRLADNRRADSLANRFRRRRGRHLAGIIAECPAPVRVLDVGGTQAFWEASGIEGGDGLEVCLLNLQLFQICTYVSEVP